MLPIWDKPQFLLLLTSKAEKKMDKKPKPILQRTLPWNKPYAPLRGEKEDRLHLLETVLYFLKTGTGFVMTTCWKKGDRILPWLILSCSFLSIDPDTDFRWTFPQAKMALRAHRIKGKFVLEHCLERIQLIAWMKDINSGILFFFFGL